MNLMETMRTKVKLIQIFLPTKQMRKDDLLIDSKVQFLDNIYYLLYYAIYYILLL